MKRFYFLPELLLRNLLPTLPLCGPLSGSCIKFLELIKKLKIKSKLLIVPQIIN